HRQQLRAAGDGAGAGDARPALPLHHRGGPPRRAVPDVHAATEIRPARPNHPPKLTRCTPGEMGGSAAFIGRTSVALQELQPTNEHTTDRMSLASSYLSTFATVRRDRSG